MFDKSTCKQINAAVEAALKPLEQDFGVKFHTAGGTFTPDEYRLRLSIRSVNEKTGQEANPLVEDFKLYARRFGLKPEMLGAEFMSSGRLMSIFGLRLKARRAPIIARDTVSGKLYRFNVEDVRAFLKAKDEPTVPLQRTPATA